VVTVVTNSVDDGLCVVTVDSGGVPPEHAATTSPLAISTDQRLIPTILATRTATHRAAPGRAAGEGLGWP
jgi:hypothetical protein